MFDNDVNEEILSLLDENGYILTEEDIRNNPVFLKSKKLLIRAVEKNPSLVFNVPELRQLSFVMEIVIEKEPSLIAMIGENCYLDYDLTVRTLEKYKITKEDLERNPALTRNYSIMRLLPEFNLYSAFLSDDEKKAAMIRCLSNDFSLTKEDLPFLDKKFGGIADLSKLVELVDYLKIFVDETDINQQKYYYQILDKVIDGIVNIRYMRSKVSFKYPDIVSLNDSMVELFNNVTESEKHEMIDNYVKDIYAFIGQSLPVDDIRKEIDKYYDLFSRNGLIDLSLTNQFCNRVLNQHMNYFKSKEKERILNRLILKINLNKSKKKTILNGKKLEKIAFMIRYKEFEKLGITEEDFIKKINDIREFILNNKKIKKLGVEVNTTYLDKLIIFFIENGYLNDNIVSKTLRIDNEEVVKLITRKFESIKLELIDKVTLTIGEERISNTEKIKIGAINYVNFLIFDKNKYLENLTDLLLQLDDELLTRILKNGDLLKELGYLLPLINLIERFDTKNKYDNKYEFDTKTFINILLNYERIRNKIIATATVNGDIDYKDLMLRYIDNLITLANAYSSVDDISLFALGDNVVSMVGDENAKKYLDFYLKMFNRQIGFIPSVSLETDKYYLESGFYSDPDRLLIGQILNGASCIDLYNLAGGKTFNDIMLKADGDVILIKDKKKKLISRIILFRRGNVIQMVSNMFDKHSIYLYKQIADIIMEKAISNNDNIDYIFVNTSSVSDDVIKYPVIEDVRFLTSFPHADFAYTSVLIGSKNGVTVEKGEELNLNFEELPRNSYIKPRRKISYSPTEMEISRIRALDVEMENDKDIKENKARAFEPFYMNEYKTVICGEDWYIALRNDGVLEKVVLPSNDPRTHEEVDRIMEEIFMVSKKNKIL